MTTGLPPFPFENGDHVYVNTGPLAGHTGVIKTISSDLQAFFVEVDCSPGYGGWFLPEQLLPINSYYDADNFSDSGPFAEVMEGYEHGSINPLKIGMSSEELATYVEEYIGKCASRIRGDGAEQYETPAADRMGPVQKFESMDLDDLLVGLQEELEDVSNYAAMLDIKVQRIRNALKGLDKL